MGGDRQYRRMIATIVRLTLLTAMFSAISEANHCMPGRPIFLIVVHRHGARLPVFTFKNNPNYAWPARAGSLTAKGQRQLCTLARTMKERYVQLLPGNGQFNAWNTRVKSSSRQRCKDSSYAFLGCLMNVPISPAVAQMITFEVMEQKEDNILLQSKSCPHHDAEMKKWTDNPEWGSDIFFFNKKHSGVYQYLSRHVGETVRDSVRAGEIYDTLLSQLDNGVPLPAWAHLCFPYPLNVIKERGAELHSETKRMRHIRGKLATNIVTQMKGKISGHHDHVHTKFHAYSAHDSTLVNLMRVLGLTPQLGSEPGYGAALAFELYDGQNCNDKIVKIAYFRNGEDKNPMPVSIPDCKFPCKFSTFEAKVRKHWVTNADYDNLCRP